MEQIRKLRLGELSKVAEFIDRSRFVNKTLSKSWNKDHVLQFEQRLKNSSLNETSIKTAMQGGLLSYLLHW
jgi:adenosylcobinamide amidohydrolase